MEFGLYASRLLFLVEAPRVEFAAARSVGEQRRQWTSAAAAAAGRREMEEASARVPAPAGGH